MDISIRKWIQIGVIVAGLLLLVTIRPPFSQTLTRFDFRAYWGASYLLAQSQNFSDPAALFDVQVEITGWQEDEPLMTWNPPWLLAWLLPYALLSFERASWLWFLTNLILVAASTIILWQLYSTRSETSRKVWVGFILTFLFIPTLTTLLVGQIISLVLIGLAAFLLLDKRRHPFASGLALALTTIKPQLLFLTLPLVILELIRQRNWRALAGLSLPIVAGILIAFAFRPTFVSEYVDIMLNSNLVGRTSVPTLTSFLADNLGWPWFRFVGVILVLIAAAIWWKRRESVNMVQLVLLTLVVSLVTTPFGWSFDFILFLAPILQLAVWFLEGKLPRSHALAMTLLFILANVLMFRGRANEVPERTFFWFPIVMAALYIWGWWLVYGPREQETTLSKIDA